MKHKTKIWNVLTLVILASLIAGSSCSALGASSGRGKPNVILILTDDMDFSLAPQMEHTQELIARQGVTFTNYFVTSPLCCPSRSSMIRGQYPHNTNILENTPGFRNFFRNGMEEETIAVWLSRAGYETALMGKYMNGYPITAGNNYVPPGWSDWHAFFHHGPENDEGGYYFNYTMNENGELVEYGYSPEEYSTDVLRQRSVSFIEKNLEARSPFFLLISTTAPHGPSIPAPRHEGLLADLEYPQKPSFLTEDVNEKPAVVLDIATVPGEEFDAFDANRFFRNRAETLLAVDEMILEIVRTLEQTGQLENTYIIFTSDNGFHLGEHNFSGGKGLPYIEDVNVPFYARGPGIAPNTIVTQLAANIDLAPTIAEIAGAKTAEFVDGRSILPLLQSQGAPALDWRNALLVEAGYTNRESRALIFRSIRTETYLYVEYFDGTIEFYDLAADPYERQNLAAEMRPETLSNLNSWLEQLKTCQAEGCRDIENAIPVKLK
ncbi:MAG: sulfatase [Anaerolineales bacterium]|nr:sulfatase [Anaerolineales bacterium]NUQ83574.1 sulfatase [Anaerolineales bacterium]